MPKTNWSQNVWKSLQAGVVPGKAVEAEGTSEETSPSISTSAMEGMGPDGPLTGIPNPSSITSASSIGTSSAANMVWTMPMVSAIELSLEEFEPMTFDILGDLELALFTLAEGRSEPPHVTVWCMAQALCEMQSDFMEAPLVDGITYALENGHC
jgi:hypothetical protein